MLAAARDDPRGALDVMAVTTGMRRSELLALQWNEVDLEAAVVHVRATLVRITGRGMVRGVPKTASSRRSVPLPATTVAHLRRHGPRSGRRTRPPVWLGGGRLGLHVPRGAPLSPSNLTGEWHATTESGRPRPDPLPQARHTTATVLLTAGVPLAVISKTLGHSGLAITADIYATVVPQLQRDAADAMQRALAGPEGSPEPHRASAGRPGRPRERLSRGPRGVPGHRGWRRGTRSVGWACAAPATGLELERVDPR